MRRELALGVALGLYAVLTLQASGSTAPLGLDIYRPIPADNPLTSDKIALGRRLFHDRRLSRDGTRSCASCHDPGRAFTDGRVVAVGVNGLTGRRNAPTIINRAYGASFFWDGRAVSLETQVVQPLVDPREMATTPEAVVATVRRDAAYRQQFQSAFESDVRPKPDVTPHETTITLELVARALASYVRTVRSGDSRFDRFQHGDRSALTDDEQRGLRLFLGRAECWNCHAGPNLTDERFHNTGIAWVGGRVLDEGRFAVSRRPEDRGAFKTPTLREVARTAPYMHDGSLATLDAVLDYYGRGGNAHPGLDPIVGRIRLTPDDKRALVAFLKSLTGTIREGH